MSAIRLLLPCFFLSMPASANVLRMEISKTETRTVETQLFTKMSLTKNCFKNGKTPNCEAYKATTKKNIALNRPDTPLAGHPAAFMCGSVGGLNRILKDPKNNEYDYCEFKDGSMIDSWDLYTQLKR